MAGASAGGVCGPRRQGGRGAPRCPPRRQPRRRVFLGSIDGKAIGYISYAPVWGSRPGWLHDLSRRRADVPPGVMEAINSTAMETFRGEGAAWLHFGFTPFVGLDRTVAM